MKSKTQCASDVTDQQWQVIRQLLPQWSTVLAAEAGCAITTKSPAAAMA